MKQISRQRKWQLENLAAGKCKLCPKVRAAGDLTYCAEHREAQREYVRKAVRRLRARATA